jgi:MATE family multidrug resistance protein
LRRSALLSSLWGGIVCAGLAVCFALFGGAAIDTMTTAPKVQEAARRYLPYMVAAPVVGLGAWMLDGIFIGATRTKDMRNMMVLSAIVYFLTVFPLMAAFGNHGLWLGLLLNFIVRGVSLGWKYPALEAEADRPRSGPVAAT